MADEPGLLQSAFQWLFGPSAPAKPEPFKAPPPAKSYPSWADARDPINEYAFYGTPVDAFARGLTAKVFAPGDEVQSADMRYVRELTNPDNAKVVDSFPKPYPKYDWRTDTDPRHSFAGKPSPGSEFDREGGAPYPQQSILANNYARAGLAVMNSPVAQIGYDPGRMTVDVVTNSPTNIGGAYNRDTDTMFVTTGPDASAASSMAHESVHRGLQKLREAGMLPALTVPFGKVDPRDPDTYPPANLSRDAEEVLVRAILQRQMGNPERDDFSKSTPEELDKKWSALTGVPLWGVNRSLPEYIQKLDDASAKYTYQRKPRGGPR